MKIIKMEERNISKRVQILFGLYVLVATICCSEIALAQSSSYDGNSSYFGAGVYGATNSGFGLEALNPVLSNTGPRNTATGRRSLWNNSSGELNTAVGYVSMQNNMVGSQNTALGANALFGNNFGNNNTAAGYMAMQSNNSGSRNTAVGFNAMLTNIFGDDNTAMGYQALNFNNNANNFGFGGYANSSFGYNSGLGLIEGNTNSAFGSESFFAGSNAAYGTENAAFGYKSMYQGNAGGFLIYFPSFGINGHHNKGNTALGVRSMTSCSGVSLPPLGGLNECSEANTGVGANVLMNIGGGRFNTAIGYSVMPNTNGWVDWTFPLTPTDYGGYNVAVGVTFPLNSNVDGSQNTVVGGAYNKLAHSFFNTAVGYGFTNLVNTSPGNWIQTTNNTLVGNFSFNSATQGYNNTAIGYGGDVIGGNWNNVTVIGLWANAFQDNMVKIGDVNLTMAETQTKWHKVSDGRFKFNVREDEIKGMEFIKLLRPVNYNYDKMTEAKFNLSYMTDSLREKYISYVDLSDKGLRHTGFIAQEVQAAGEKSNYKFHGASVPKKEHEKYTIDYSSFVLPLIKTIQEQQLLLKSNTNSNEELKQKLQSIKQSNLIIGQEDLYASTKTAKSNLKIDNSKIVCLNEISNKMSFLLFNLTGNIVAEVELEPKTQKEFYFGKKVTDGIYLYAMVSDGKIVLSDKILIEEK